VTEAEKERLAMLAEEAGEIIQMVGKILRHGYDNYHPNDPMKVTNRELLVRELQDLDGVTYGMIIHDDIDPQLVTAEPDTTWRKKLKWTYHQDKTDAGN
jgi:hypothetical protein